MDKNHTIISIVEENAFDKIQYSFMVSVIKNLGNEGTHHSITKALSYKGCHIKVVIYDNPIANIY
jgi:hypothetical protein